MPQPLRTVVVLCELDGLARKDAAARLGVPEGTLSSRLAKARKLLAARLRSRGVSCAAAGFAALGSYSPVSAELADRAIRAALGAQPPTAAATQLSHEVLQTMLLTKLKYVAGLLACLLVVATLVASSPASPEEGAAPAVRGAITTMVVPGVAQAPMPREPVLMLWAEGAPVFLSLDGKVTNRPDPVDWHGNKWGGTGLTFGRLSPDGKRVLFSEITDGSTGETELKVKQMIRSLDDKDKRIDVATDLTGPFAFWSRDGKRIYGAMDTSFDPKRDPSQPRIYKFENWMVDLATGKKTVLALPKSVAIQDVSADGQLFLVIEMGWEKTPEEKIKRYARTYLTTPVEKPTRYRLAPDLGDNLSGRWFSPDESHVLALRSRSDSEIDGTELRAISVESGKSVLLNKMPEEKNIYCAVWSPDGKQVAYVWLETAPAPPGGIVPEPGKLVAAPVPGAPLADVVVGWHVMIVDADGKNRKKIHTEKKGPVQSIDWR